LQHIEGFEPFLLIVGVVADFIKDLLGFVQIGNISFWRGSIEKL
jgi:hypothetical protein